VAGDQEHRRYQEDLAAYLLGALEGEEARDFERHLAGCATCQVDERWLHTAVQVLPSSVEPIEPPPELRERLMGTVRAEASDTALPSRPRATRRRGFGFLRPAMALGAGALIVLGGLGGYLLADGEGGGASTVAASPSGAQPGAGGEVVKDGETAILRVHGLKQERGREYEVWVRRKGSQEVEPASLFGVHEDGTGAAAIPGGVDDVAEVLVSSEPAGGSPAPTSDPVLSTTL